MGKAPGIVDYFEQERERAMFAAGQIVELQVLMDCGAIHPPYLAQWLDLNKSTVSEFDLRAAIEAGRLSVEILARAGLKFDSTQLTLTPDHAHLIRRWRRLGILTDMEPAQPEQTTQGFESEFHPSEIERMGKNRPSDAEFAGIKAHIIERLKAI